MPSLCCTHAENKNKKIKIKIQVVMVNMDFPHLHLKFEGDHIFASSLHPHCHQEKKTRVTKSQWSPWKGAATAIQEFTYFSKICFHPLTAQIEVSIFSCGGGLFMKIQQFNITTSEVHFLWNKYFPCVQRIYFNSYLEIRVLKYT